MITPEVKEGGAAVDAGTVSSKPRLSDPIAHIFEELGIGVGRSWVSSPTRG